MAPVQAANKLCVVELYAGTARSAEPFRKWKRARLGLLVDTDRFAYETYFANYPDAPYLVRSVGGLRPQDIIELASAKPDILLGCPPCQGLSEAGSRDPHDRRNIHLKLFADLATSLKPLAIGFENVPLAAETIRFRRFVRDLRELGYAVTWKIVNSALYGSAQCRHRLLMVAIRGDVGAEPVIPTPTHGEGDYYSYGLAKVVPIRKDRAGILSEAPSVRRASEWELAPLGPLAIPTVGSAFDSLPPLRSAAATRLTHVRWQHSPKTLRRMAKVSEGHRWAGGEDHYSHSYGRLHHSGLARTITTYFANAGSGRFWHPRQNRALTVREAARLQGFPDSFEFFPTYHSARLVGNALDSTFAQIVYNAIREAIE